MLSVPSVVTSVDRPRPPRAPAGPRPPRNTGILLHTATCADFYYCYRDLLYLLLKGITLIKGNATVTLARRYYYDFFFLLFFGELL